MALDPFGAALTFSDDGIFLLELLGGFRQGLLGLHQTCGQLAAQPETPVSRKRLGLLQSSFLRAGTVLAALERGRAMPGQSPAPVDVDLSSEDFVARHTGPLLVSHFDMGTGNHANKDASKGGPGSVLALC